MTKILIRRPSYVPIKISEISRWLSRFLAPHAPWSTLWRTLLCTRFALPKKCWRVPRSPFSSPTKCSAFSRRLCPCSWPVQQSDPLTGWFSRLPGKSPIAVSLSTCACKRRTKNRPTVEISIFREKSIFTLKYRGFHIIKAQKRLFEHSDA